MATPLGVKNSVMPSGETSTGLKGKKYRVLSNGAKKAIPRPPLVRASKRPCEAVAKKKKIKRRYLKAIQSCPRKNVATINGLSAAAKTSEWVNPRWPRRW
jgi:hypothetical protein